MSDHEIDRYRTGSFGNMMQRDVDQLVQILDENPGPVVTEDQIKAGVIARGQWVGHRAMVIAIYRAMYAARPARGREIVEVLADLVQYEANHGADSPVDRGDAEQIVRALIRHPIISG